MRGASNRSQALRLESPLNERTPRLFIGLGIDGQAAAVLCRLAAQLKGHVMGRYVDPCGYHLTLAFLGAQPESRIDAIRRAMEQAAALYAPFSLRLGDTGLFDTALWAGLAPCPTLASLAAALRAALSEGGIGHDARPFIPRITLVMNPRGAVDQLPNPPPSEFPVDRMTLYESTRAADGPAYTPRLEVSL